MSGYTVLSAALAAANVKAVLAEEARVEAAARGVATAARWMAAAGHAAAVAPGRLSEMSSDEQDSLATLLEDLVEATSQEKVEGPPRSAALRRMAFSARAPHGLQPGAGGALPAPRCARAGVIDHPPSVI